MGDVNKKILSAGIYGIRKKKWLGASYHKLETSQPVGDQTNNGAGY